MFFFFYLLLINSVEVEVTEIDEDSPLVYFLVGIAVWLIIGIIAFIIECKPCSSKSKERTSNSIRSEISG